MPYIKSDSGFILPLQTGKTSSHHHLDLAAVSKWRTQHATSDLTSSAGDLYLLLQDMHQTLLKPKVRYEMLSILQPSLSYLCQGLEKLYYRQEILSENQRAIADLVYALHKELLNGYKLVIHDALKSFFVNKRLLLAALNHAMHTCIKILFHAFEQHRHPPQNTWLELHHLFAFAVKKRVAHKSLSHTHSHSRFKTLEDMYKHSLLFAIANPHRLRKEQIAHLTYAMDAWAPLLSLKEAVTNENHALFIVDTESDAGPKYSILYPEPTKCCYYLLLTKVNQRLMRLLVHVKSGENSKNSTIFSPSELALPKPFIEALLKSWQQISERIYQREKVHGFVTICLGISSSFHYIQELETQNANRNTSDPAQEEQMDIIDINMLPEDPLLLEDKTQAYSSFTCELMDSSEKGYCLKWLQEELPPQLVCGEIIALENESQLQKRWSIGTIRWLKHEEGNILLIGVQLLSTDAIAVKAHLPNAPYGVVTLLLAEHENDAKDLTLITPPLPFKSGQEIVLEYRDKSYHAHLQTSYNLSPSYQEFELEFVDEVLEFPTHAPTSEAAAKSAATSATNKRS